MAAWASNVIQVPTPTPDGVSNEGGRAGGRTIRAEGFLKIGRDVVQQGKLGPNNPPERNTIDGI